MRPTSASDTSSDLPMANDIPFSRRAVHLLVRAGGRVMGALAVLLGAATAAFIAQLNLPGDRATSILNIRMGQAIERTPQELAPVIEEFGLDRSPFEEYLGYVGGLLRGDLGTSYQQFRPVSDMIGEQLRATAMLTITALVFAWLIMVVWVTLTAGRRRAVRSAAEAVETVAAGLPGYWLGIILLTVFAQQLGWFPVLGGEGLHGLVLPGLTLAIPLAGFMGQATRAAFERSLQQPFVLTARTRGMPDLAVRLRHVLRHAILPPITLSGWAFGAIISGAVAVEAVFTRRGIGSVLVTAVDSKDLPVVTGIVMMVALFYVMANLVVDILYRVVDPRIRLS
jgi:peptide/nickel transport system permease protein